MYLKYQVRKGTMNDVDAILAIIVEAQEQLKQDHSPQWQNYYPNYDSITQDIMNDILYVAVFEDEIIGTMSIVPYDPCYDKIEGKWLQNGPYVAIHRIAVKQPYQSKGVASFMLHFVEEHFTIQSIRIDTHKLNERMQALMKKNGFTYCGIIYLNQKVDRERLAYEKVI